jgi:hypothetical protein
MQSAYNAAHRTRQAVLDERGGVESGRTHHVRIEGAAGETALISVRNRSEKQGAGDARNKSDVHNVSLPAAVGQACEVVQEVELMFLLS